MNNTHHNPPGFARAYAAPLCGQFRILPEDFIVDEQMDIALSGTGEHLWLQVRKTSSNTDWVAIQLANIAGMAAKDVGYAGQKDRHAVTTQWYSLQLPGKADPDFSSLPPEIEILQRCRHDKKLRRGALSSNRFVLTLRYCTGDFAQAESICQQIASHGVPNYYGEQRFGNEGGNVEKATRWFSGELRPKTRNQFSLYLSAARSWIFNHILSQRVAQGTWNQRLPGDVFMLEGSHAWFADDNAPNLQERLDTLDIHPSGVLWGKGELDSQGEARALESEQAAQFPILCAGLEKQGLKQERRALRIKVGEIGFEVLDAETLRLSFTLPPGAYATVLLEQLGEFTQAQPATAPRPAPNALPTA
jgi:tRNA pseudouridine13 synthase